MLIKERSEGHLTLRKKNTLQRVIKIVQRLFSGHLLHCHLQNRDAAFRNPLNFRGLRAQQNRPKRDHKNVPGRRPGFIGIHLISEVMSFVCSDSCENGQGNEGIITKGKVLVKCSGKSPFSECLRFQCNGLEFSKCQILE